MNNKEKLLIKSIQELISPLELIELYMLKILKPKSFKRYIDKLDMGYSHWAAKKELKWKN